MGSYSEFKSRKAIAKCSDVAFYQFVSDLRNFERLTEGNLSDWTADASTCSFSASPVGKVNIELASAQPSSGIQYSVFTSITGKVLLDIVIEPLNSSSCEIMMTFSIEMNPLLRMMIGSSIDSYLEKIALTIEGFDDYKGESTKEKV